MPTRDLHGLIASSCHRSVQRLTAYATLRITWCVGEDSIICDTKGRTVRLKAYVLEHGKFEFLSTSSESSLVLCAGQRRDFGYKTRDHWHSFATFNEVSPVVIIANHFIQGNSPVVTFRRV
jgi:hypothetical protein